MYFLLLGKTQKCCFTPSINSLTLSHCTWFKLKVPALLRLVSFSGVSLLTLTCCSKSPDSSGPNGEMVSLLMSCRKEDAIEIKKWCRHAQISNPNVPDIHNIHLFSQIIVSRNSTLLFLTTIHKLQWVDWWVYQFFLQPLFFWLDESLQQVMMTTYGHNPIEQDAIHIWKHLKLSLKLRNPSSLLPLAHNTSYEDLFTFRSRKVTHAGLQPCKSRQTWWLFKKASEFREANILHFQYFLRY